MTELILNRESLNSPLIIKQPKALYLLTFAQMFESFSYYGMRCILLLYMASKLDYSDSRAYGVFTIYITLVEFNSIFGGYLADRFLGLRPSLYLGSIIIALGHICMAISYSEVFLYYGLSFIILGSALFKVNCCALLGEFYQDNDLRSQPGFTIFYTGINIGAFIATIACAYLAENIGWEYGFGLAAIGMFIGILALSIFSFVLENKGLRLDVSGNKKLAVVLLYLLFTPIITSVLYNQSIFFPLLAILPIGTAFFIMFKLKQLTLRERRNVYTLLIAILLLSIFYAFQEQIGSTFVLFIERCVDRNILGLQLPSSSLSAVNPCTIIIFGFIIARLFTANKQRELNTVNQAFYNTNIAFGIITLAYGSLYLATKLSSNNQQLSILYPLSTFVLIALAELFIGPTLYTLCITLSPMKIKSQMLGVLMSGYAMAGILSGYLSQLMAIDDKGNSQALANYSNGFLSIGLAASILTIILFVNVKIRRK